MYLINHEFYCAYSLAASSAAADAATTIARPPAAATPPPQHKKQQVNNIDIMKNHVPTQANVLNDPQSSPFPIAI